VFIWVWYIKVVIFSQWTSMLDLVQHAIREKYKTLIEQEKLKSQDTTSKPQQVRSQIQILRRPLQQKRERSVQPSMQQRERRRTENVGDDASLRGVACVSSDGDLDCMEVTGDDVSIDASGDPRRLTKKGTSDHPVVAAAAAADTVEMVEWCSSDEDDAISQPSVADSDSGSDSDYTESNTRSHTHGSVSGSSSRNKHVAKKRRTSSTTRSRGSGGWPASSTREIPASEPALSTGRCVTHVGGGMGDVDRHVSGSEVEERVLPTSGDGGGCGGVDRAGERLKVIRFDGAMNHAQRNAALSDFNNNPDAKILLISLK
jgi:hypothetical protein